MTAGVLLAGATALVAVAAAMLARAVRGPTVYDRVLAVNAVGTVTVVVIAVVGAALDEPGAVDVALAYALLNFLLAVGVARLTAGRGEVL